MHAISGWVNDRGSYEDQQVVFLGVFRFAAEQPANERQVAKHGHSIFHGDEAFGDQASQNQRLAVPHNNLRVESGRVHNGTGRANLFWLAVDVDRHTVSLIILVAEEFEERSRQRQIDGVAVGQYSGRDVQNRPEFHGLGPKH